MERPEDCTALRKLNLSTWHKVEWVEGPNKGKIDLMRNDLFEKYQLRVKILETIKAESCARGIRLGWGLTEEKEIDAWISANRVDETIRK